MASDAVQFLLDALGESGLSVVLHEGSWVRLTTPSASAAPLSPRILECFHGTTLHQASRILAEGFHVGRCHRGTPSSPCGLWFTTEREHCLDRAPLIRGPGYARSPTGIDGWDVPVAIRLLIPKDMVKLHVTLDRGCRVGVFTCAVDSMLNLKQDPEVSVLVHRPCLERYMMLPSLWQSLKEGRHVACRALSEIPEVLFSGR